MRYWLGMVLLGLFGLTYAVTMQGTPGYGLGLACIAAVFVLALVRSTRRRKAQQVGGDMVTTVVVRQPLLPVPMVC